MSLTKIKIGEHISIINEKNTLNLELPFYGINKDKEFMPTVATTNNLDRAKYKIMTKGRFVFSGMQTGRDMCIRIGLYDLEFDSLVSPAYTTFEVKSDSILSEYLFMLFRSKEMDRYGAFLSDGSVRSNLDWPIFADMEFLVPSITIQKKYIKLYEAIKRNLNAVNRLGLEIADICPILIRGAMEEGGR